MCALTNMLTLIGHVGVLHLQEYFLYDIYILHIYSALWGEPDELKRC